MGTAKSNRSFRLSPKRSDKNGKLLLPMRGLVATPWSCSAFTPLALTPFVDALSPMVVRQECRGLGRTSG